MITKNQINTGTVIRVNNEGPFDRTQWPHKYIVVKEIKTQTMFGREDIGIYSDVYYVDKAGTHLNKVEGKDIFVDFLWLTNLNKRKLSPVIVGALDSNDIGIETISKDFIVED